MMPKLRRRSTDERTGTMTLIEHLEELRHRVVLAFIALLGGAVVGWFLYPTFINIVTHPFCDYVMSLPTDQRPPTGCDLVASGALDQFSVKLKVVFALGLFVALPVILYQLWAFIVPGLTSRERRMAVPFIASSMVLFTLGGIVAYLTLPHALEFLLGFAGDKFTNLISGSSFIGFVVVLTLAFGVSFELPVGGGELLEHQVICGVALVHPVEAHEQHRSVALDGEPAFVAHSSTIRRGSDSRPGLARCCAGNGGSG